MSTHMDSPRVAEKIGHGIGRGAADKPGLLRIVVAFDEDTFAEIRARAVAKNTSFAQQVRELVEWGLIA